MKKQYTLAIDLHGTLLDKRWKIPATLKHDLEQILKKAHEIAHIYIATGNDYDFVKSHVPQQMYKHIDGYIVETGCFILGMQQLVELVDDETVDKADMIRRYLRQMKYPFVKHFGSRDFTISLFTTNKSGGEPPQNYLQTVQDDLLKHKYGKDFYITYSSVALDIIPVGINKWVALKYIADDTKTVAFIDSYNDKEIALHSDITFLPQNSSPALIEFLENNGKRVLNINNYILEAGTACLCDESYTAGVIQGLGLFYFKVLSDAINGVPTKWNSDSINAVPTKMVPERSVGTAFMPSAQIIRPEWVPENASDAYTTQMIPASLDAVNCVPTKPTKVKDLKLSEYIDGILNGNKTILARAITLIESNAPKHFDTAQQLITALLPHTGKSTRIAITGMPGAGKSTFIETFGLFLIDNHKKPAILAIDPSSTITKGSILGDKTRMELLSKADNAFIRPSPSAGTLGGVARKTKETILLCEAAGYDIILIETVGVGQSEVTVRSMVDFFLLLLIAGAGDELQGIKKGVIELADAILINKADGDNVVAAQTAASQYNNALHYLANATPGWKTNAYTCSAVENTGISEIWNVICDFVASTQKSGIFEARRVEQTSAWFDSLLTEEILATFYQDEKVMARIKDIKQAILNNEITPIVGVKTVLNG